MLNAPSDLIKPFDSRKYIEQRQNQKLQTLVQEKKLTRFKSVFFGNHHQRKKTNIPFHYHTEVLEEEIEDQQPQNEIKIQDINKKKDAINQFKIPSRKRLNDQIKKMLQSNQKLFSGKLLTEIKKKHNNYLKLCEFQPIQDANLSLIGNTQKKSFLSKHRTQNHYINKNSHYLLQIQNTSQSSYIKNAHLKYAPTGLSSEIRNTKDEEQIEELPIEQQIKLLKQQSSSKLKSLKLKLKYNFEETRDRNKLYQIIKKNMLKIKKFKALKLQDLLENQVFSQFPFQKPFSKQFILSAKKNDHQTIQILLEKNKYLVFDFDYLQMTALHWASKKGHLQTTKILIDYQSDLDAEDAIGRTPLYLALENGNNEIAKLLLYHHASPWSTEKINYSSLFLNNPHAKQILSTSRKVLNNIHILLCMTPPSQRETIWIMQALSLYVEVSKMYYY